MAEATRIPHLAGDRFSIALATACRLSFHLQASGDCEEWESDRLPYNASERARDCLDNCSIHRGHVFSRGLAPRLCFDGREVR